ncbi:hypothetical protein [Streptomyces corynorhini]|uniref:LPXTG cell wall anchor domain-containing protein n=1 Tax=Streptomyces corynorhini TaxID=2282652 RepID=A0A370BBP0_9ACTN|nr:hypothetical protein [Streptomyces corynorhini]RDG39217.1 hypothetical protein DVH02_04900 [Streptomyces corynorhini]
MTSARGTRIRIAGRTLLALLVLACWPAGPGTEGARAEGPVTLGKQGRITDKAGALGDDRAGAGRALDRPHARDRVRLSAGDVRGPHRGPADQGAAANLVLPVAVVLGAAGVAAYTYTKRKRRMARRTTPGGGRGGGRGDGRAR